MAHVLDGARFKIHRAQKHLQSLKDEIGVYLSTKPYEFPADFDGNTATARAAIIKDDPPRALGGIVSDSLGNLRPILDYVAWELAAKHSPVPLDPKRDRIYFPLQRTPADFSLQARPKLTRYSVPTAAIDLIESVQPYHAGYETLVVLNDLINEDKHRLPLLAIGYVKTASIQIAVDGPPIERVFLQAPGGAAVVTVLNASGLTVQNLGGGHFRATGAVQIGGSPTPPPTEQPASSVKVDGEVSVFVSLKNDSMPLEPVERMLESIVNCVASIVPRFDPFFE